MTMTSTLYSLRVSTVKGTPGRGSTGFPLASSFPTHSPLKIVLPSMSGPTCGCVVDNGGEQYGVFEGCFIWFDFFFRFILHVYVTYMYVHAPYSCLVPVEVRSVLQILWNWNDGWSRAIMWVLGSKTRSSIGSKHSKPKPRNHQKAQNG